MEGLLVQVEVQGSEFLQGRDGDGEPDYQQLDRLRDARSLLARSDTVADRASLAGALHQLEAAFFLRSGFLDDAERSAREGLEVQEEGSLAWAILTTLRYRALEQLERVYEIDGPVAERAWRIVRRERFPVRIASSTAWAIQLAEALEARPILRRRAEAAFGEEYFFELSGAEPETDPNPIAENGGFF